MEKVAQFNEHSVYEKIIENVRNKIDVKLAANKKDYWKRTS